MAEKWSSHNQQFDTLIPTKQKRPSNIDLHFAQSPAGNDQSESAEQSQASSVKNSSESEIAVGYDDNDDRVDYGDCDEDDGDRDDSEIEEKLENDDVENQDKSSRDPISDLTRNQRIVLYVFFLGGDIHGYTNLDNNYSMGEIDVKQTVRELEEKGFVESDSKQVWILSENRHDIMNSYRENCLLSELDKDFFIDVACEFSIHVYMEMYIFNQDDFKKSQNFCPITLMRLIVQTQSWNILKNTLDVKTTFGKRSIYTDAFMMSKMAGMYGMLIVGLIVPKCRYMYNAGLLRRTMKKSTEYKRA